MLNFWRSLTRILPHTCLQKLLRGVEENVGSGVSGGGSFGTLITILFFLILIKSHTGMLQKRFYYMFPNMGKIPSTFSTKHTESWYVWSGNTENGTMEFECFPAPYWKQLVDSKAFGKSMCIIPAQTAWLSVNLPPSTD